MKRTILYVDDEAGNRVVFEAALEDRFRIVAADSAKTALEILAREAVPVVVADQRMPGTTGVDLFDVLRVKHPQTRRILLTAYTEPGAMIDAINRGQVFYFLQKPWDRSSIEPVLVRALEAYDVAVALEHQSAVLARQNEELRSMKERLEQASRLKSEFLANMSHEIRTPMTSILGFTDVLRERLRGEQELELVETIKRNGEHLLTIINDILDLSKIEAGTLKLDLGPCSPRGIAADVAALIRPRCEAKGLWFDAGVDDAVPRMLRSDALRLRQILLNLLTNAVKFTDCGGVRIDVRLAQPDGDAAMLRFDVVDSGIGIDADRLQSLFQPFNQLDASMSRRFAGTGLGLAISRRLAQLLGGDIGVRSVPGQGSTFSLTVPAAKYQSLGSAPAAVKPETTAEPPPPAKPKLPAKVLVAEDSCDSQRLLTFILEKAGAKVTAVANGRQAVDEVMHAAGTPYDLVLMDMHMPVLDGYDATAELRRLGYGGNIIAVTAHAMSGDRQRCLDAGCDEVITKPFQRERLLARLGDFVAQSE